AALIQSPVTPNAIKCAVRKNLITHYAAALARGATSKSDGDHITVAHANAVVLFAGVPAKLQHIAMLDDREAATIWSAVLIGTGNVIVAGDIGWRCWGLLRRVAVCRRVCFLDRAHSDAGATERASYEKSQSS